mgnify:CR=1 FL=1|jgi:hypothetical protein
MSEITRISYSQNAYIHVNSPAVLDAIENMFNTDATGNRLILIDADSLEEQLADIDEDVLAEEKLAIVALVRDILKNVSEHEGRVADLQIYA